VFQFLLISLTVHRRHDVTESIPIAWKLGAAYSRWKQRVKSSVRHIGHAQEANLVSPASSRRMAQELRKLSSCLTGAPNTERSRAWLKNGPRGGARVWGAEQGCGGRPKKIKRKERSREMVLVTASRGSRKPAGFNWLRRLAVDTSCCNQLLHKLAVVGTLSLPGSWNVTVCCFGASPAVRIRLGSQLHLSRVASNGGKQSLESNVGFSKVLSDPAGASKPWKMEPKGSARVAAHECEGLQ
jgi:hypothetical protein